MPDHRGQTYDPQQEPPPQGGWFRLEDRPFPEKADRVSKWVAAGAAITADAGFIAYMHSLSSAGLSLGALATAAGVGLLPAALAYGFTRGIGMIVVSAYGAARHGPELAVDWRAVRHDLPLRRTWIVVLEGGLLLAAACTSVWGLMLFLRHGLMFGLVVFLIIAAMIYWPPLRRWIAAGRTRG